MERTGNVCNALKIVFAKVVLQSSHVWQTRYLLCKASIRRRVTATGAMREWPIPHVKDARRIRGAGRVCATSVLFTRSRRLCRAGGLAARVILVTMAARVCHVKRENFKRGLVRPAVSRVDWGNINLLWEQPIALFARLGCINRNLDRPRAFFVRWGSFSLWWAWQIARRVSLEHTQLTVAPHSVICAALDALRPHTRPLHAHTPPIERVLRVH